MYPTFQISEAKHVARLAGKLDHYVKYNYVYIYNVLLNATFFAKSALLRQRPPANSRETRNDAYLARRD